MKTSILAVVLIVSACAEDLKIGKPLSKQPAVSIADLAAKPDAYVGKSFQVKGTINEVCQVMGAG
jgi:hypothetical protein